MTETDRWPNVANLDFVEDLYARFLEDPATTPEPWRGYFTDLARESGPQATRVGPSFRPASLFNPPAAAANGHTHGNGAAAEVAALQDRVDQLVRSYRVRGHMHAELDPLGLPRRHFKELDLDFYGFTERDLERQFSTNRMHGPARATLREILERLKSTYCRSIGVQFMHIDNLEKKSWLQERMEGTQNHLQLPRAEQLRILTRLTDAVMFEEFIQKKFLGAKSFSLEGCESLIPLLDLAIDRAGEHSVAEIVLGMAHRGRLNVLANILGKSPREIFREFADADGEKKKGRGDVKYHLGYSSEYTTSRGKAVHLSLCFNPSHLEFVNPVALGRVRAKQDRYGDRMHDHGMAILIHGDASFIGQGVVQESLNLSQLAGFATGGTLHVIVNNQIGFTTDPRDARSSPYCTDVAKMLQIPIFHVNGEDPEAVAQVVALAMDFRHEFKSDVVIDMYGYRRRGHNEGDEPAFTQPVLYNAIRSRKPVREGYLDHLLALGNVKRDEADEIARDRRQHLEDELSASKSESFVHRPDTLGTLWQGYVGGADESTPEVETRVPRERLADLLLRQVAVPAGFRPHPKIERMLETRAEMAQGKRPLDWGGGEALALASLLADGTRVRITGQDCERGTFSHRHAVLHDVDTGARHTPLEHLDAQQGTFAIYNSSLSEPGVMGFEYGYSLDCPEGLVVWEAQFGDFCNVAQVIIDQFLVSAEEKWRRLSGLVLLLPHGFEGQGPEHSSARLERFLSMSADDNIQVVNLTTPAQLFHCLRRQVLRPWRKPLIVMSPKSLLRHPRATSTLEDCASGSFRRILPDTRTSSARTERVLLCSGKIYYELEEQREKDGRDEVAILRLEQLYPLSEAELRAALAPYSDTTPVVWIQEEPENMGAWRTLYARFGTTLFGRPFSFLSRPAAASPATGSTSAHKLEQQEILTRALAARAR
ncbi:MAG: 2-oxoglutarate dehydrogenase E1 component [Planctomycetota bacterium]